MKADAAGRVFAVNCQEITWAIIDTGIDRTHPAFAGGDRGESRVVATFDIGAGIDRLKAEQKVDIRFVGLLDDDAWGIFREGAQVAGRAANTGRSATFAHVRSSFGLIFHNLAEHALKRVS